MKYLALLTVAVTLGMTGCSFSVGTNATTANNSNAASAKPAANVATSTPAPADSKVDSKSTGSMATPTETYKTAYEYRKNKDIEGLKKVMSKDMMEFVTVMSKDEGKTLDDALKELCAKPQADKPDVRNEKIDGDHATIEVKDEKGEWGPLDFEKVGSEWKMTLPKADKKPESGPKKP